MAIDNQDRLESRRVGQPTIRQPLSGIWMGARWNLSWEGTQPHLVVNGRRVRLRPDDVGSFTTHAMTGRWRDLGELAHAIIRFHPRYSPLARRGGFPVA